MIIPMITITIITYMTHDQAQQDALSYIKQSGKGKARTDPCLNAESGAGGLAVQFTARVLAIQKADGLDEVNQVGDQSSGVSSCFIVRARLRQQQVLGRVNGRAEDSEPGAKIQPLEQWDQEISCVLRHRAAPEHERPLGPWRISQVQRF